MCKNRVVRFQLNMFLILLFIHRSNTMVYRYISIVLIEFRNRNRIKYFESWIETDNNLGRTKKKNSTNQIRLFVPELRTNLNYNYTGIDHHQNVIMRSLYDFILELISLFFSNLNFQWKLAKKK